MRGSWGWYVFQIALAGVLLWIAWYNWPRSEAAASGEDVPVVPLALVIYLCVLAATAWLSAIFDWWRRRSGSERNRPPGKGRR